MPHMQFNIQIQCQPEAAFALIADLPNYSRWLPSSGLYGEVMQISDNPIKQGTTYLDQGQSTPMHGSVIIYEPPAKIGFQQSETIRLSIFSGDLTVRMEYTLQPKDGGTHLTRDTTVTLTGILRLLQPVLMRRIRAENERILACLKAYLEKSSG